MEGDPRAEVLIFRSCLSEIKEQIQSRRNNNGAVSTYSLNFPDGHRLRRWQKAELLEDVPITLMNGWSHFCDSFCYQHAANLSVPPQQWQLSGCAMCDGFSTEISGDKGRICPGGVGKHLHCSPNTQGHLLQHSLKPQCPGAARWNIGLLTLYFPGSAKPAGLEPPFPEINTLNCHKTTRSWRCSKATVRAPLEWWSLPTLSKVMES